MAYIDLFDSCNELTLQGVKNIKLMSKLEDNSIINFPIDIVILNGTEIVVGSIDTGQRLVTIGGQVIQYIEPSTDFATFEETKIEDRRGSYYNHTLSFQFPKLSLLTNNQIKDFAFDINREFAIVNTLAIITDNNDVEWIVGYDSPLVVESFELGTGGDDNLYNVTLNSNSYQRIRRFKEV